MGCERMGVLFGLFRTLLMPLLLMTCDFDGFGAVVSGWGYDSGCFGLFWVLLMPLFAHDLRFCRSARGRVRTGVCAMGLAWV